MEEKKRKSSRSFELEKGGKRSFDLQKTSTRKFDLSKDSDSVSLEDLKKELMADGKIDAEEVNKLREVLYADGKIDREEADFLFGLNDAVSGKPNDSSWKTFFVEAISDYLLNDKKSPGVIDEEEGKWLCDKISADGKTDEAEKQLLTALKQNAQKMPATVNALIANINVANTTSTEKISLQELKMEILADGKIDKDEVNQLRKVLYADGKIDQEEADFLFELKDTVNGKKNDPAWNQFFVQSISDYLLKDEKSPGVIDEEEGKWLIHKIGYNNQIDGTEKLLLENLKKNAKKVPASVTALINSDTNPQTLGNSNLGGFNQKESNSEAPKETSIKWLWILLAIIITAVVSYYFIKSCNNDKREQPFEQVTSDLTDGNGEQTVPQVNVTADSTNEVSSATDDEASDAVESPASDVASETGKTSLPEESSTKRVSAMPHGGESVSHTTTPNSKPSVSSNQQTAPAHQNIPAQPTIDSSLKVASNESVEKTALDVIRGLYGNGLERKQKLGDFYKEVQDYVNDMYRKGLVN